MKRPCGAQGQEGLACEGTGQGLLLLCSRVRLGPGSLLLAGIKRPKRRAPTSLRQGASCPLAARRREKNPLGLSGCI